MERLNLLKAHFKNDRPEWHWTQDQEPTMFCKKCEMFKPISRFSYLPQTPNDEWDVTWVCDDCKKHVPKKVCIKCHKTYNLSMRNFPYDKKMWHYSNICRKCLWQKKRNKKK